MILALTGATGFVGGHLLDQALAAGHAVRALTRRPQPARPGVAWLPGTLEEPAALARLVTGADAVIHVAGVVNAPTREGFAAGNIEGTRAVLRAASEAGVDRFIHVSSLAAREPALSTYGWSKHEAERLVEASGLGWTIVRPTGVYGAGDTEMLDMFRMVRLGIALLPPPGRVSLIEVGDLARLLLRLAAMREPRAIYEADDGTTLSHADLARAIGVAVGRPRVLPIALPASLLALGARLDRRLRGDRAKLTPDRARYLSHPDWTGDPALQPPAGLWKPAVRLRDGLAATARWYREQGLL